MKGSSAMRLIKIPTHLIHTDPPEETLSIDKEFAEELAKSIKADGCLHPPTVTPIEPDGHYRLVAGKHRLYAMKNILGRNESDFCIVEDVDLKHAEAMALAENIWRKKLSDGDFCVAMIRWYELYAELNPDAEGSGGRNKRPDTPRSAGEFGAAQDPAPVRADPFYKEVESTLSVSPSKATRIARMAKNMTEDQAVALAKHDVNGAIIDKVAALGKGEPIDRAIELISSGINHEEAVRQAAQFKPPKSPKPGKNGAAPQSVEPKAVDMPDEEWLRTYCATPLSMLKHKISFKIDAILYRRVQAALAKMKVSVKKHLVESRSSTGLNGQFYANVYRISHAAHPSHWLVCSLCGGTGKSEDDVTKKCSSCGGAAYRMKLED
jgi:ParB-like nuclease domain